MSHTTTWSPCAFKLAAGWCPAPAFKHKLASICLQAGCGLVSRRTSFQAQLGLDLPSSWLRVGVPHQLSSTTWPRSASSWLRAGVPHQLSSTTWPRSASSWLRAQLGLDRFKLAALVSRTSFQAQLGLDLPSSWLRANVPHQQALVSICIQAGCGLLSRASFQAQLGLDLPSSWLWIGVPHQFFKHNLASICLQAGCGLVSRTSFQAQLGLAAGVPHQLSSTTWSDLPLSWLRASFPHQLSSTTWPGSAFKLAAGWCSAPAFKHNLASICLQAGCRLVRTGFQAQVGFDLPSSWLRVAVSHQLSSTIWFPSACKLVSRTSKHWFPSAFKLAASWCPAPAFKHNLVSMCLQAGCKLSSTTWSPSAFKLAAGRCPAPAFKHKLASICLCKPTARWCPATAFKHNLASICLQSWLRVGVPHQLSSTTWPRSASSWLRAGAQLGLQLSSTTWPPAFKHNLTSIASSWLRAGVPHQLSSTTWPQSAFKLAAGWCPAPASTGFHLPSSWLRAGVPHQLSSTTWPRSAFKLAAGWCPAPGSTGFHLPSSWLRAGAPHQLSSTTWPRSAFKLAAGWCPAPAFEVQFGFDRPSGCGCWGGPWWHGRWCGTAWCWLYFSLGGAWA